MGREGEKLLNLCAADDNKVKCSLFCHYNIHKWTSQVLIYTESRQSTEANVQCAFTDSCLEATLRLSLCAILLPQLDNNCEMNIGVHQANTVHSVLHFY